MAIPASELVRVQPRVLAGTGQDLAFNGLFLDTNAAIPANTLVTFRDASSVSDYFGASSAEYRAARVYFNGYNNSFIKPTALYFWRANTASVPAFIRGKAFRASETASMLSAIQGANGGSLTVSYGAKTATVEEVATTAITSPSAAAEYITTALAKTDVPATCRWDAALSCFFLTAPTADLTAGLSISITGSLATAMGLDAASAAASSLSALGETYTAILNHATETTQNFVTFSTIDEVSKDDALLLASWSNAQYNESNQFLYVWWSTDGALKTEDASETAAAALADAGYIGTAGVYGAVEYAAFLMGAIASIDWDRTNGAITLAYKAQSGLAANVAVKAEAANLTNNGVNFMGDYASRNDAFILFQPGQTFGAWKWIDAYINSCWLNNALQVQILAGMEMAGRVPYNTIGYSRIRAWCADVIDRALNNGVIDRGVNLSQTQINELINEAGEDISTELYGNGYVLQILDADATIRQSRTSPSCNFWYTYAGSVHKINLPSTAVV